MRTTIACPQCGDTTLTCHCEHIAASVVDSSKQLPVSPPRVIRAKMIELFVTAYNAECNALLPKNYEASVEEIDASNALNALLVSLLTHLD